MISFEIIGYEIAIALVTASLLGIGNYVKNFIKNKRIEKKYPVSGEYLSYFDDEDSNGNKIRSYAPAIIKQKGKRILGKSYQNGREWTLEGHISDAGWIYGTYYSKKINDTGIGNFFLSLQPNGSLEGIWSGYGAIGKKVLSGRYIFNLINKDLIIKRINRNNYPLVLQSFRDLKITLNKSLISKMINDENHNLNGIIVYNKAKDIIGGAVYGVIDYDEMIEMEIISDSKVIENLEYLDKIPIITHIIVSKRHRGVGIGTQILNKIISEMKNKNVETIFAINNKSNLVISDFWENNLFNKLADSSFSNGGEEFVLYGRNI